MPEGIGVDADAEARPPTGGRRRRVGFRAVDNAALLTAAKWVGSAVFILVAAIGLYLGAVLSVYVIAWVIDLIGIIFG